MTPVQFLPLTKKKYQLTTNIDYNYVTILKKNKIDGVYHFLAT